MTLTYKWFSILAFLLICTKAIHAQRSDDQVKVTGAMRNVMKKGQLQGTILLDTIAIKKHLYGLGPKEYLQGELLIVDGRSYLSQVAQDGSILMEETYDVKAPFLVYTHNERWSQHALPDHVRTMKQLEEYIDQKSLHLQRPFVFKLEGTFTKINFHIQNLPEGTVVRSFEDAHQGQGKYERANTEGTIVGFFSTEHQSVFTHHDSYIHMHYINADRTEMGHIDDGIFNGADVKLFLPIE